MIRPNLVTSHLQRSNDTIEYIAENTDRRLSLTGQDRAC